MPLKGTRSCSRAKRTTWKTILKCRENWEICRRASEPLKSMPVHTYTYLTGYTCRCANQNRTDTNNRRQIGDQYLGDLSRTGMLLAKQKLPSIQQHRALAHIDTGTTGLSNSHQGNAFQTS